MGLKFALAPNTSVDEFREILKLKKENFNLKLCKKGKQLLFTTIETEG